MEAVSGLWGDRWAGPLWSRCRGAGGLTYPVLLSEYEAQAYEKDFHRNGTEFYKRTWNPPFHRNKDREPPLLPVQDRNPAFSLFYDDRGRQDPGGGYFSDSHCPLR